MRAVGEAHREAAEAQLEVLWAGDEARVREALVRLGVRVTRVHPDRCLQLVASRAPDMLVFSGSAAAQADAAVRALRASQPGASLPVSVISRDVPPSAVAQRAGLVARLSAELAPSVLAADIYERLAGATSLSRLRELALSSGELEAWLSSASEAESSGFLLTSAGAIAFGPGGRVVPSPERLYAALAQLPGDAGLVKVLELPANRLLLLREPLDPAASVDLAGARISVVHPDLARGEVLCTELCGAGAVAQAVGVEPTDIARVAGFAPALVVIASAALERPATTSLWQDARLGSASWLVLDESGLKPLSASQILGPATRLSAEVRALRQRLADRKLVVDRIESFGAAGWLREVGRCEQPLTLLLKSASGRTEVSLAAGKIRGAAFVSTSGGPPQQGQAALQASLALPCGRVLVGPHEAVMAHEASLQADQELVPSDVGDEPAPSEIRERAATARAVEPNTTPSRSFRPSTPAQFSAKSKAPPPTVSVLPLSVASVASMPASEPTSSAPAEQVTSLVPSSPAAQPPAAREDRAPSARRIPSSPPSAGREAISPPPLPSARLRPPAARDDTPAARGPSLKPSASGDDAPPAPIPSLKKPFAAREDHPPPGAGSGPARHADHADHADHAEPPRPTFDVELARGVAAPPSVRSRPPLPPERAEPGPARVSVPHVVGMLTGSPGLGASGPPPLPVRGEAPAAIAPVLVGYVDASARVDVGYTDASEFVVDAEHGMAPITPIASELEPVPAPPALPAQSEPHASRRPRAHRAMVVGAAAAAIGVALVAIVSTGLLRTHALQPSLSEPAGEIALSREARERARSSASAALAQRAPRPVAAPASVRPDEHATPAEAELRPTPIPRGSDADELLRQAKQARDESRPQQAEALLSEVLTRYPNDFGARYHMALTLVRLRRFEQARAQLSKALALNSESASAWLLEGDIFLQEGRRREALRAWSRCLEVQAAFPTCQERLTRWRVQ